MNYRLGRYLTNFITSITDFVNLETLKKQLNIVINLSYYNIVGNK